jgi:hypothetical protein
MKLSSVQLWCLLPSHCTLQLHQVQLLHNNLKDLQLQADVESRSMNRRLDTAISDRCYELLYKVQDLSSKLKMEKRNLVSLESTVRENLKKEFQEQISELNTQLTVVKGQFAECVPMLAPLVVNFICVIMRVCACNVLNLFSFLQVPRVARE